MAVSGAYISVDMYEAPWTVQDTFVCLPFHISTLGLYHPCHSKPDRPSAGHKSHKGSLQVFKVES